MVLSGTRSEANTRSRRPTLKRSESAYKKTWRSHIPMKNPLIFYPDSEEEFWQRAKVDTVLAIRETLKNQKECRLGLAGGHTPKHLYEMLADEDLPWERIRIILIDERYVPSDHAESNLHMLRDALLKKIALRPENLLVFDTSLTRESAAEEMSRKLSKLCHERSPLFDFLILGAGADGHIASLFEDQEVLVSHELVALSQAQSSAVQDRLTLTLKALENSMRALLLLKGQEKLAIVQTLEGGSDALRLTALKNLLAKVTIKVLAFLN